MLCWVAQSCPTLCDPMNCSPPGSSVHGDSLGKNTGVCCHALLQGIFPMQGSNPGFLHCRQILYHLSHQGSWRILEWVAYPFFRASSWTRNRTLISCVAGVFFTNWSMREALITFINRGKTIGVLFVYRRGGSTVRTLCSLALTSFLLLKPAPHQRQPLSSPSFLKALSQVGRGPSLILN